MARVGLVFDHIVFVRIESFVLLFVAPKIVREVFWGSRDSHLRLPSLQCHRDAAGWRNKGPTCVKRPNIRCMNKCLGSRGISPGQPIVEPSGGIG